MSPWKLGSLRALPEPRVPRNDHPSLPPSLPQVYTILLVQLLVTLAVVALFTFW